MILHLVGRLAIAPLIFVAAVVGQSHQIGLALAQGAGTVVVQGETAVVSNTYEQAGGLGYDTFVVFWVKNTDSARAAVNVPYRVTLTAGGSILSTSDGRDTVTVWPNETRLVAHQVLDSPVNVVPDSATVQVYPSSSMMRAASASAQNNWSVSNIQFRCQQVVIECEVIGDLTWSGSGAKRPVTIAAAALQGGDDGPVIGAGTSPINAGLMDSGQVAPFRVSLRGFDQPIAARPPVLTDGPLSLKFYVESPP